jgi:hypothetical protein
LDSHRADVTNALLELAAALITCWSTFNA